MSFTERLCKVCDQVKPITDFSHHMTTTCNQCKAAQEATGEKMCSNCKEFKSITEFREHPQHATWDNLYDKCKTCEHKYALGTRPTTKVCNQCGQEKSKSQFTKRGHQYTPVCKLCLQENLDRLNKERAEIELGIRLPNDVQTHDTSISISPSAHQMVNEMKALEYIGDPSELNDRESLLKIRRKLKASRKKIDSMLTAVQNRLKDLDPE